MRHKCPVGVGFTRTGGVHVLYCGQWSCVRCRKKNAKKWAGRARNHLKKHHPPDDGKWYLLTLTLGREYTNVSQGYAAIVRLWDTLRKRFRRAYQSWSYLAFVEGQPNRRGMPHFHILSNRLPPAERNAHGVVTQHALHAFAHRLGWGYQVDLQTVDGPKAASYVSKYVSKGDAAIPKGFRRVRSSRGWEKSPKDPEKRLIVPARGEGMGHFMARVSELTGVDVEQIYDLWTKAWTRVYNEQIVVTDLDTSQSRS